MKIVPYSDVWLQEIEKRDPSEAQALSYNKDVFMDTAIVAEEDGTLLSWGYLSRGTLNYGTFGIYAEFGINGDEEKALEGTVSVLESLKASFQRIKKKEPYRDFKCALTIWTPPEREDYIDFIREMGFKPDEKMVILKKHLDQNETGTEAEIESSGQGPEESLERRVLKGFENEKTAVFKELDMTDPQVRKKYFLSNGKGFGYPDSEDGMLFRMEHWKARVYAFVTEDESGEVDEVLAAVTVWPRRNHAYATEDIFCIPEYRRQHLTTDLLRRVLSLLKKKGAASAGMNAYLRNKEALSLYEKMGYQQDGILESYIIE